MRFRLDLQYMQSKATTAFVKRNFIFKATEKSLGDQAVIINSVIINFFYFSLDLNLKRSGCQQFVVLHRKRT